MGKILTISIPTYNRSKSVCEQIKRLNRLDEATKAKINVFISDNCSSDDTQEKVLEFKGKGIDFEYSRNEKNLGPDLNFEICYRHAKTTYVWLLGDDDFVIPEKLCELVDFLEKNSSKNYGLVHIKLTKENEGTSVDYDDPNRMIQDMGIMSTFLSANVVNTKFIADYDFAKYVGSFFIQVPLELRATLGSINNAIITEQLFGECDIHNENGGYNIYKVFVENLLGIYKEARRYGLSVETYRSMKMSILEFMLPYTDKLLLHKNTSKFKTEGAWSICFRYYGFFRFFKELFMYKWHQHFPKHL